MTNSNRTYKSWRLKTRPSGEIKNSDLELVDDVIPEISENEILVCATEMISDEAIAKYVEILRK